MRPPPPAYATRQEGIVGGLIGVVLHEAARALFDMLRIPRLSSESDAADQISAFASLQFGGDVARVVIKGTYYVLKTYDDAITAKSMSQVSFDRGHTKCSAADLQGLAACAKANRPSPPFAG